MSAKITWLGLDDLRAALKNLPVELTSKAAGIVSAAAETAAADIRATYPEGETGNLRKGVRVGSKGGGAHTVRMVVRSTAPHAFLYEYGTTTRQTKAGAGRGHMFSQFGFGPRRGANVLIPIVERTRRRMFEDLIPVLEESGLDVRR
jgi:hypothetical protein